MLSPLNTIEKWAVMFLWTVAALWFGAFIGERRANLKKSEPHAVEVVQADASRILERNPETKPPAPPIIPKGATVTRITTARIAMDPVQPGAEPIATVQLTQIQTAEGPRVIASTADGQIIGGSDWTAPVGPPAPTYHWQALAVRSWDQQGRGAWGGSIGYTRGRLIGTVTILPGSIQAGVGFRW
jgi:hypothetical protein